MPVALPEPDGERDGIPLWLCPNCNEYKLLQEYSWKKRRIFARASKSGSSKVIASSACRR